MELDTLDYIIAIISAGLAWFVGAWDGFIRVLVAFVIVDYITGLIAAFITHTVNSNTGFNGIMRKGVIFLLVGIANIIDNELLGHSDLLRDVIIFFYLGNEGISILENAIKMGLPFPESFRKRFQDWVDQNNSPAHNNDTSLQ